MMLAILDPMEVNDHCHPYYILWTGRKEFSWFGVVGDNLKDRYWEWNPPLEINLAKIWHKTQDAKNFTRFLSIVMLEEYLHIEVRNECTGPPMGTGSLPIGYKGRKEEWYMRNLLIELHGGEWFCPYHSSLCDHHDGYMFAKMGIETKRRGGASNHSIVIELLVDFIDEGKFSLGDIERRKRLIRDLFVGCEGDEISDFTAGFLMYVNYKLYDLMEDKKL